MCIVHKLIHQWNGTFEKLLLRKINICAGKWLNNRNIFRRAKTNEQKSFVQRKCCDIMSGNHNKYILKISFIEPMFCWIFFALNNKFASFTVRPRLSQSSFYFAATHSRGKMTGFSLCVCVFPILSFIFFIFVCYYLSVHLQFISVGAQPANCYLLSRTLKYWARSI